MIDSILAHTSLPNLQSSFVTDATSTAAEPLPSSWFVPPRAGGFVTCIGPRAGSRVTTAESHPRLPARRLVLLAAVACLIVVALAGFEFGIERSATSPQALQLLLVDPSRVL